ncbi:hypothetical protein QEG98_38730 [Myxococcus sp. MxC21-1]|uniref:hypothetical protein n=1 Tax=Myxococcus sp. MxC21-1 TaxID=3041439 RepID=UPI002930F7DA|nr:hypothetical protein [Myxococcus sp. MxC21-1]WNZ61732.1 hypothetical protein QEG98_38730 [Myxococcus sp. MxC21-1]
MVAALALWGCGEPAPEGTPPPAEPVVTRIAEDGLACTPEDIATGDWMCTGGFTYSLECYARQTSAACGADTSPKTCTSYGTCRHADFGSTLGVHQAVFPLGTRPDASCEAGAQNYMMDNAPASTWGGITWTWYIGGRPPGGGTSESMLTGGGALKRAAAGVGEEYCYITYSNYPVPHMGTGPQCGTVESPCTVACLNPQTCQVNGAWVTDAAQCGTMTGLCGPGSGAQLQGTCRDVSHGLAPDAECGAGFVEGRRPPAPPWRRCKRRPRRSGWPPGAAARPSMTRPSCARSAAAPSR